MSPGRRRTDKGGTDRCEWPSCNRTGSDYEYISYAVNPKTEKKGMWLCPQHAAPWIKRQYDND